MFFLLYVRPPCLRGKTVYHNSLQKYLSRCDFSLEGHSGVRHYVPLQIIDQSPGVSVSSVDELDSLGRCVILGIRGAGKSTELRHLTLQAVIKWQTDPLHNLFPIWVDLARWQKGSIQRYIQRVTDIAYSKLTDSNLALYFDNLDHLTKQQLSELYNWIEHSPQRPARVILTCFRNAFLSLDFPLEFVTLADSLDVVQIEELIERYLGQKKEPLRSILLLHTQDAGQQHRLAEEFPQAKDPVLLMQLLTYKPTFSDAPLAPFPDQIVFDDPDDFVLFFYYDLISRPGFLAPLLLNYSSLPIHVTPFNIGAVVHVILTNLWLRYTQKNSNTVSLWDDTIKLCVSIASRHLHKANL